VLSTLNQTPGLEVAGEAGDGLEAIESSLKLKPDLILLDIGLPHLSGIEVARRVGEMLPRTKIIFLTQNSDKDLMAQSLSIGGMGYAVKADFGSELLPAIEAVLQGTNLCQQADETRSCPITVALRNLRGCPRVTRCANMPADR
jgi:DNA-binding NarL/FixJ family response regulator